MAKEVYWHLPGFCVNFYLNQIIINLMHDYPDKFYEGYKVGSVYGTFPGAIWNGGRTVLGFMTQSNMETVISAFNKLDTPVRFTWTNSLLQKEDVYDRYCNTIMKVADNGKNQVLCNTEVLENYLREKYPSFKFVSSTTKRIKTLEALQKELDKDFFMAVLDYDLNHDETVLKALEPQAERVEILVDEVCFPNCPKRTEHYKAESYQQLEFDKGKAFQCPNFKKVPEFSDAMKRPAFISREEIKDYIDRGYVNFKLVGRGLPEEYVKKSYLYYLVKEDAQDFIEDKIEKALLKIKYSK